MRSRERVPRQGQNVTGRGSLESLRPVVNGALRRLLSRKDPEYEDVVQTALEGVLATIDEGRFGGVCPPKWAATIARNVAIDQLRARARERRIFSYGDDLDPTCSSNTQPEQLADLREQLQRLYQALDALGPRRATVVYLHDVLGYELPEIAGALGTSVAAAQSRLVRGRHALSRALQNDPQGEPSGRRR
jgi:RNA polymerase sigma-70 factor, ECF subfamily